MSSASDSQNMSASLSLSNQTLDPSSPEVSSGGMEIDDRIPTQDAVVTRRGRYQRPLPRAETVPVQSKRARTPVLSGSSSPSPAKGDPVVNLFEAPFGVATDEDEVEDVALAVNRRGRGVTSTSGRAEPTRLSAQDKGKGKLSVVGEDPEEGVAAEPLMAVPLRTMSQSGVATVAGQLKDLPSRMYGLTTANHFGVLSQVPSKKWLRLNKEYDLVSLAEDMFNLPTSYDLEVPTAEECFASGEGRRIPISQRHFEFGLRFPLHPFIVDFCDEFGVCVGQLHPNAIRSLISYIWVCQYLKWTPSLKVIRTMCQLKVGRNRNEKGWFSLADKPGFTLVRPKLDSVKEWRDSWFWVVIPDSFKSPRRFQDAPSTPGATPRERMAGVTTVSRLTFTEDEEAQLKHFTGSGDGGPDVWLPHFNVISSESMLGVFGLSLRSSPEGSGSKCLKYLYLFILCWPLLTVGLLSAIISVIFALYCL
jgi:Putative gypsy type transposon